MEKDKQIAALVAELDQKQAEANDIVQNMIFVDESNAAMDVVIEECERTIAQLGEEKEKDVRSLQEIQEKVGMECAQAKDDLQVGLKIFTTLTIYFKMLYFVPFLCLIL